MRGNERDSSYDLLNIFLLSKLKIRLAKKFFCFNYEIYLGGFFFLILMKTFIKDLK